MDDKENLKSLVDGLVFITEADAALKDERDGWFNQLLKAAMDCGDHELMFSEVESEYKGRTMSTSMPSTYRSAKTVIGKAISLGVDIYDENMNLKGKTRLEQDVRALLKASDTLSSNYNQVTAGGGDGEVPKNTLEELKKEFYAWYDSAIDKLNGKEITELDEYIERFIQ